MKTILVDAVYTFVSKEGEINKELRQLLESYPNKKIILTNADYKSTNKFGLNDMPYKIFTLKHNPNKTNSEYFHQMLDNFKLKAGGVVYFEHNLEAIKSAQSVGISTHHYDKDKKDLKSLRKFLDDNL